MLNLMIQKTIFLNFLVFFSLKGLLSWLIAILSLLYIIHNIRGQIEGQYGGDWKKYIATTFKPFDKGK